MANPIYCDMPGCEDPEAPRSRIADFMVQRLDGTLAEAWCALHWPLAAVTYADTELRAQGSSLGELLSAAPPGPDEPTDEPTDEPVTEPTGQDALGGAETGQEPPEPSSEGEDTPAPVPAVLEAPSGPTVVKRGTSPSRRAYQARKRAKQRGTAQVGDEGQAEPGSLADRLMGG